MEHVCGTALKIKSEAMPLPTFWIFNLNEYAELSQLAINILLLFGTA
jgi:hypothetical protein